MKRKRIKQNKMIIFVYNAKIFVKIIKFFNFYDSVLHDPYFLFLQGVISKLIAPLSAGLVEKQAKVGGVKDNTKKW